MSPGQGETAFTVSYQRVRGGRESVYVVTRIAFVFEAFFELSGVLVLVAIGAGYVRRMVIRVFCLA
jgi:hypothetical protein